jgi:hypothetical protein
MDARCEVRAIGSVPEFRLFDDALEDVGTSVTAERYRPDF